jgi:RHH-type proline utilization regulon transcriptional repressor/proline dehydrogenase/delta 1-pyrroline-5-carboxylate dehydrogenase
MIGPGSGGLETPPAKLEAEVQRIGRELAGNFPSPARHPLRSLDQKAMQLTAQDAQLAAALFRLVDVTPACRSVDDLSSHLIAYLDQVPERPPSIDAAMRLAGSAPGRKALGSATAAGVRHMAHRFIVGESPGDALRTLTGLWRQGIASSVDLLGEATVTTDEADRYAARCDEALETLSEAAPQWPRREWLERDSVGAVPRVNLSVKVTALTPLMRPQAPDVGREDAAARLRPLLCRARDLGAHLHVDMESVDSLETTAELVLGLLAEPEFAEGPSAGVVLQAYLRDSPAQLERMLEWSRSTARAAPLVVRLVKGAYWDHEVVEARQHGWSPPVFEDKGDCDRNFEQLTRRLLDARPLVRVNVASHNLRSVAHAIAYNRLGGGGDGDLELQVLRGLGDELAEALRADQLRVRSYCPVGDLVAGMAYLVRRLLENSANDSFLRAHQGGTPVDELLAAP